ncbi:hypothetical protein JRQ81_010884 [Phrynocephalus forsythii]|uniref:Snake toxin/toxin-like domain-containing protein n=1 Tax=Phrynocephalus forsythii TaxID=171643 RepID=A0A9Q0Y0G3_9SAUR|nr:hypothetical protein JRQ81_010884 [Phrynocephalus forsythii]
MRNPTGVVSLRRRVVKMTSTASQNILAEALQSITKDCSTHCPKGGLDLGVMAFSINCCETSLCNTSGAISVKSNCLLLAMGTLASLLYIFGAKL